MLPLHRNIVSFIFFLIFINVTTIAKKPKYGCPIGFNLAYTKYKGDDPLCYRRKGPESFTDKFKDCDGNLYTSKLYSRLNISESNLVLWTDYKSLYPGGPFIDWSYTESTGDILVTTFDVRYDPNLGLDEDLCVVIDPVSNYTATRCDEQHYRYCFVKPYVDKDDLVQDGCRDLKDYYRFWSPKATCLTAVTGVGGGTVRASWKQAKELCLKRGGSLLSKSWRYANNPILSSNVNPTFPLGIILSPDNSSIRYDAQSDDVIPTSEWHFDQNVATTDTSLGALRDNFWYMVNNSYIFFDVICERTIELKPVSLTVTVDPENKLILTTSERVKEKEIYCFSDSLIYFPTQIKVRYDDDTGYYVLRPVADGYYWCVHVDSRNHTVSESNKALFIREKQSLINYYSIKIKLKESYKFENLEEFYKDWTKKLEEYIFYYTKYTKVFGEVPPDSEDELRTMMGPLQWRQNEIIHRTKIKRLFLDGKTALVHVQFNPEMMPVTPGHWDGLEVLYMKPIYFCKGFDSIPMLPLGSSIASIGCRNHSCVGDFNEGVQWVTTGTPGCSAPPVPSPISDVLQFMPTVGDTATLVTVVSSNSSEDQEVTKIPPPPPPPPPTRPPFTLPPPTTTTDYPETSTVTEIVTTMEPTTETIATAVPTFPPTTEPATEPTTPRPAEEQLQQVMENLENLLHNDTNPVLAEDPVIHDTFDKVDTLLETGENLEIPGELLHLLDELGSRIDLNGSASSSTIRSNIALVLADAGEDTPVRGLRIAARDDEAFTKEAFKIISEKINMTHLNVNESEAVVHLPESVSRSSRRVSFVVFRTDRAFRSDRDARSYTVNSRVLSINVENLTHFSHGEVIDIHLSPMSEYPDRNQSRACAYWQFLEDGTGYWSQDGCTLIRSNEAGVLDTCRCDHLTHFAEILVPRAVFSERSENVLEILSIIGCVMSLFGLVMIGLTAILFRSWRRDYSNKIWLQLCIAIFLLIICFLIIVFQKFDTYDVPCMLIGVALHYSVLASFCWMLVAAVLSYRRLVIVFTRDASHKLLRASAFSWGVPCAIVGILLSVHPHSYAGRFEEKTPSGAFCYPSGLGLWLAVYAPIAVLLVANWTLFALIVRSVFASRRIQRHGDSNEALRCASVSCLLVFLFGLPWVFGLFAYNVVAAYLFTLTATFQGFVLFLFFVLGNKKTRDLWLNKLKIKQTRKVPVTSSTYTHRSGGTGYRGSPGASTIEANSSKPKSLSSPDNSRFS